MTGARTSEEWAALAALVDRLLDAPPSERDSLIGELSAGDPRRRSELEALLRECEHEPTLFQVPAVERFAGLLDDEARFPKSLSSRYRLTRELGRGGMATVFLARDLKHGRDVAIKVLRPVIAAALGSDRFLREIEIAARLHHPQIAALYDSGDAEGALYYVMPYEAELSLRHRLTAKGPLAPDDVVLILRDVCDALAYAHARGIVHRDIKPDNVLISGRHAVVTDFGIALITESEGGMTAGVALGTPAYMAPEQIDSRDAIDHRADIYALGVLGYELLTGQPPFAGDTRQAILAAHLRNPPTALVKQRPDVPVELADLIMRCLEKAPADRWQRTDELLDRLEALAGAARVSLARAKLRRRWMRPVLAVLVVAILGTSALASWLLSRPDTSWAARWTKMRIERFTDFPGSEVDPAISRDGQYVAFLANRDSLFDAFVSRVGSGALLNLTHGRLDQLYNDGVSNIGFTNDRKHVWLRVAALTTPASVSVVPVTGGQLQPFLPTAVMAAWSGDGSRLAYHETTPGDPIFVAAGDGSNPKRIYIATPGIHSHYLSWSPNGKFLYFAHGVPPNEMDIWRIPSTGGRLERITSHNSQVGYPVLVDDQTLLYTATDDDGTGPWLYMMDLSRRVPVRLTVGVEHFSSVAASAEMPGKPRRLVAAVSNPVVQLWNVPIGKGIGDEAAATRLTLPTARTAGPRFAPNASLFYLASRGGADGLWRFSGDSASEVWLPSDGAVTDPAGIAPNGKELCFVVRHLGRSTLRCAAADFGTQTILAPGLDVRGAPSWSPDGKWIAVAARDGPGVHVYKIPAAGGAPIRLVDSVSSSPVWSPDGKYILYSATPRGRGVPLKAIRPDGTPVSLPFSVLVDRLGDSYRFLPDGNGLVLKIGGFRSQDFWLFDVATGARRQLTRLKPGDLILRFDVSPDGRRIVFERVRENSDIALIEVPAP